uniref:NADH-ubiquinone oxidoreductase chain 2 n=1 Tax=Candida maltosa TaxID=5479 RepID=D2CLY4_CANMA|nr:NADH dehydrogenase subunit 2 [Candida maltosa]ABX10001.1 NADH dehydrogenase subunit 2 [Candida maltosa]
MLLISLVTYIVYISYNQTCIQHVNRLAVVILSFLLYLAWESLNIQYSNFTIYNDWFSYTPSNIPIIILTLLVVVSLLAYTTVKQRYLINNSWLSILIIINIAGLILFPMVNDLIPLYVIIELQSYSLYLLTGAYNKSYNSTRAAILYFVTGGIASVLILLSSCEIYEITGLTNLVDIATFYNNIDSIWSPFNILLIALIFKMGLAPLHSWSIAVYSYAPIYITAYISIVAKVSIISFIYIHLNAISNEVLIICFYLSVAVAAYVPLYQVNIKAILAYSGILNFGYLLIALISSDIAYNLYLIQYSLTHVAIFLCIFGFNTYTNNATSIWSPIVNINQLIIPNKAICILLIILLLSLVGIPPLPGFFAKYYVIVSLINNGYTLEALTIIFFSVLATYYYAFIIKQLATNLLSSSIKSENNISKILSLLLAIYSVLLISFYMFIPTLLDGLVLLTT